MNSIRPVAVSCCAVLIALSACSREEAAAPEVATAEGPAPVAGADAWVGDVQIGSQLTADQQIAQTMETFEPGQPIAVAIDLENAPAQTPVVVQWVGPQDQPLGYEIKSIEQGQDRLTFTHDNTQDWQAGDYRAEIWVNEEKVDEQRFQVADAGAGA